MYTPIVSTDFAVQRSLACYNILATGCREIVLRYDVVSVSIKEIRAREPLLLHHFILKFMVFVLLLKAVCHVNDWPLQSELNTTDFFVNLCICNKGGLIFSTFYGRRKSEDYQPFKFPILCIVIITQSNALQTALIHIRDLSTSISTITRNRRIFCRHILKTASRE